MRGVRLTAILVIALASGCGADDLFVNAHVGLDQQCKVSADDAHAVPLPVFDISPGASSSSTACDDSFVAQLWVDNPNGERVRVTSAEVRLETVGHETLLFDTENGPFPNPFLVATASPLPAEGSSVVEVEAIPKAYAPFLAGFVADKMEADITLHGKTVSGDDVDSSSFVLPISICDGCRTVCADDAAAADGSCSTPSLGPLRTFCIDPEC